MTYPVPLGLILNTEFPEASSAGREQVGLRPAVVVGVPDFVAPPVYPGLILVPFTTRLPKLQPYSRALYPRYAAGVGGLTRDSAALVDQVRYVDHDRIRFHEGVLGRLTEAEFEPIRAALQRMMPW